jgi:hypothetical protein
LLSENRSDLQRALLELRKSSDVIRNLGKFILDVLPRVQGSDATVALKDLSGNCPTARAG